MKNRLSALEGIRALTILAIIFYHLDGQLIVGGYYGVNIFLLLSGYFLIQKAVPNIDNTKLSINIKELYKQLKKLFIPMITMIFSVITYITLFQTDMLTVVKKYLLATLLFLNNYWQIIIGSSYFDTYSNQSPFTHLWYLALNIQFYILLISILHIVPKEKLQKTFLIIIISSVLLMMLFSFNINLAYYSLDRASSFFIGALLGLAYPLKQMSKKVSDNFKMITYSITSVTILFILIIVLNVSDKNMFSYFGLFFVFDLLIVIFLIMAIHPNLIINKLLSHRFLQMIGRRSFTYYLWYFPIIQLYHVKIVDVSEYTWLHIVIQLILIFSISELFYRLNYLLHSANRKWRKNIFVGALISLLVSGYGLFFVHVQADTDTQVMKEILEESTTPIAQESSNIVESQQETTASTEKMAKYVTEDELNFAKQLEATFIGDSTLGMLQQQFYKVFPKSVSEWAIGTQLYKAKEIVANVRKNNQLKNIVIFSLGANGNFSETQIKTLIEDVGYDKKIYFINNSVPKSYQNANNELFEKMSKTYNNVKVIDWYAASKGKTTWFYKDLTHATLEEGQYQFMKLIIETLYKDK